MGWAQAQRVGAPEMAWDAEDKPLSHAWATPDTTDSLMRSYGAPNTYPMHPSVSTQVR